MSLDRLVSLSKLKHISDFSAEELVTDFGMYEKVIIDLSQIHIEEDGRNIIINLTN